MPFQHRYDAAQQQAALDAIAIADGGAAGEMPRSVGWFNGSRRDRMRADRLKDAWPTMSLEDRVSQTAVMIGYYVPGDASTPRHVVTHGYEALCRTGSLIAPQAIAA